MGLIRIEQQSGRAVDAIYEDTASAVLPSV